MSGDHYDPDHLEGVADFAPGIASLLCFVGAQVALWYHGWVVWGLLLLAAIVCRRVAVREQW
jgi:hypothetical protein